MVTYEPLLHVCEGSLACGNRRKPRRLPPRHHRYDGTEHSASLARVHCSRKWWHCSSRCTNATATVANMRIRKLVVFLVLALIVICGVSFRRVYVLRPKDTIALSVSHNSPTRPNELIVSGGMTHSFMTVTHSTVQDMG